jgi:hypothetical protein
MDTWRTYLMDAVLPEWAKAENGGRLFWGALGVTADALADQQTRACMTGMLASPLSPDDILPLAGRERGDLWRYPGETADSYRARLIGAAETWGYAGADASIEGQLELAGFTGAAVVYYADREGPRGELAPYYSQFWVRIPETSLTLIPPILGRMVWGCFWWGTGALSVEDAALFWGIVNKFKPVEHVCRGIELA